MIAHYSSLRRPWAIAIRRPALFRLCPAVRTPSSGSSSRVRQKLKRRQAAFEFLVGTQGLAAPTLGNRLAATGVIPPLPGGSNPFFGFFVPAPRKN